MRIWSIQNKAAWKYLKQHGELSAKPCHQSDQWPKAYDWMRNQLINRVGPPPTVATVPLWGWHQWQGEKTKRPDLRSIRHHWQPAGEYVMIECGIPERQVLLSDFDAWHIVLYDVFLGLNENDSDNFDERLKRHGWKICKPIPVALITAQRKSWERIFDLEALSNEYWGVIEDKSIQTCFWELRLEQVISHKEFTS